MKFAWFLALLISISAAGQQPTPIEVVQSQLDAYNKQDLENFAAVFAPNILVYNSLGDSLPALTGREALKKRYATLFAKYPQNKCTLIGRMVQGDVVIDHEWITGRETPLKIMAIYEVKEGVITRCWFVR